MKSQAVLLSLVGATSLLALACQPVAGFERGTDASAPGEPGFPATAAEAGYVSEFRQSRTNVTQLYRNNCANCHGVNGEGGGGGTPSLLTDDKFDQKWDKPFYDAIKDGVPDMGMEAFGESLSEPEIWSLVVHIRELQARALRAEKGSPRAVDGVFTSKYHKYQVVTVVDTDQGLRVPWSLDWLPDGTMLVTNRPGGLSVIRSGKKVGDVAGVPASVEIGQGGLMEVKVHPNFEQNGWVYLSLNDPSSGGGRAGMTKIVRGKLVADGENFRWTETHTIFQAASDSYTGAGVHFGSKIVFDGNGHIYFSIGDRGRQDNAQDLSKPEGKIFRVKEDGSVPDDNPFVNTQGALKQIWSYGHRNPQGLAMDANGVLWDTEHAPRGGDEVNRVVKGKNYGWPVVSFAINYNDTPFVTPWPKAGQEITMPVFRWLPSTGASGLTIGGGPSFTEWSGDLIAGGLAGQNVDRIRIKDDQVVEREELIHGMGRVRDIQMGRRGSVYLVLNGPDKIVRISKVD